MSDTYFIDGKKVAKAVFYDYMENKYLDLQQENKLLRKAASKVIIEAKGNKGYFNTSDAETDDALEELEKVLEAKKP